MPSSRKIKLAINPNQRIILQQLIWKAQVDTEARMKKFGGFNQPFRQGCLYELGQYQDLLEQLE